MFYMKYFQEDFYALVDWAFRLDPLNCIAMHGITDRYLSGQKAEVAGYVHVYPDSNGNFGYLLKIQTKH